MSTQDDIFDVEDALKGKVEAEAFDRIVRWAGLMESDNDQLSKDNQTLRSAIRIIKEVKV